MSLIRNPLSSLPDQSDKLFLQTIDSLPDELLLPIFANLSASKRTLLLRICKKWNQLILLHTPFWQHLRLPEDFSPSSIVTVLSIFNERSGCRLKHVTIETKITHVKHLNRILVQLKRSGSSLNVLALRQERKLIGKTRALAMQHLPVLDSLISYSQLDLFIGAEYKMFKQRVRFGIQDQSNVEPGLKFYFTEVLLELTQEDLKWLSGLKYLWVVQTDDVMSIRRILETSANLVKLELPTWTTLEKPSIDTVGSLSPNTDVVHLNHLKKVTCPGRLALALALAQMLQIDGDQTLLSGASDSLASWKVVGLKAVELQLLSFDKFRDAAELSRLLFQRDPSRQFLNLCCYEGADGAGQNQLNQVLEILGTPVQSQSPSMIAGGEGKSPDSEDNLILPHLLKLTIEDPIMPDGKLLQKIVKSRTERNRQFQFELKEGAKVVVIDDWEARGWMK